MIYAMVTVKADNKVVFEDIVRARDKGRAITNVLTNKYRGNVDEVFVEDIAVLSAETIQLYIRRKNNDH